jgi:RHS repeat-associated protein
VQPAKRLVCHQFFYFARQLLHQLNGVTVDGASYTYDAAGNRLSKTDQASQVTSSYGYDAIYQLLQVAQGATTTESYSYDLVGNRLSSLGVSPYVYNSSNQLTSTPVATYTYDANGSTKTKVDASGTTTYNWDYENRLSSVALPAGGGTVSFKYDPFGRRAQKSGPSGTVNYLYDGFNVIGDVDNGGNVLARYTGAIAIDEPLALLRSGTTSYFDTDALGSITSLSNSGGALANTYTYDSFGRLTASTGTLINPFQYTGREFDAETGLHFYRARYFDPSTGRFLSEDPIAFDGGINFYRYVANDPVGHIDPSGLCPCGTHRVKLYYTPNFGGSGYPDYHWYRQDSNGKWSSKHGSWPVGPQVGLDWLLGPQPDQDARSWGYKFCGTMCAPGPTPDYNPGPWNQPRHLLTNNCYSYACDRLHPPDIAHKPQPGGSNRNFGSCQDVINAAESDGLSPDPLEPLPLSF